MAKKNGRYSRSRKGKLEPAVMNLSFTAPAVGTNYIDLSYAASIANRRFYRQGINWSVAGFTVTVTGTTTAPGSVTICKVPTTWVAHNAWKKSKALWDQMNDQILDDAPGTQGKYADFKVALNNNMTQATLQTNITAPLDGEILLPTDCGYNLPATGEWTYSTLQLPNDPTSGLTQEASLHILGPSLPDAKGLIAGYARSRARPQPFDPNLVDVTADPSSNWMNQLFDDGEQLEELRDDLSDDNDAPPYDVGNPGSGIEYYPGSGSLPGAEVVGYGVFSTGGTNAITAQRSIKGGMFPCGLIEVKSALSGTISHYDIIVHLVPGNHRGYMCQSMEEV